jgi:hypothetical protein
VIIKARVTDLADIPHYIIISEGDFFEGVSLTVQCEILQQDLLGGMPQDEDIPPGGFDGDFVFPGQNINNLQQLNWPLWPQHPQAADAGNVLQNGDFAGPDMNFPPVNQDPQIIEADIELQDIALPEDQQVVQGIPVDIPHDSTSDQPGSSVFSSSEVNASPIPDLNLAPQDDDTSYQFPEVLLPIAEASPELQIQAQPQVQHVNFLEPEIQPEELLNDEEIAAQIEERQNPPPSGLQLPAINFNLNLNVGLVRAASDLSVTHGLFQQAEAQPKKMCADLFRLWAKNFAPAGFPDLVVQIPNNWAPFFLFMLMDPKSFEWARSFLSSPTWKLMIECDSSENSLQFALPISCPSKGPLICEDAGPPVDLAPPPSACSEKGTPLSETAFRRSSRIKNKNKGFKQAVCSSKSCLACSAHPPGLSNKALKAIGRSICKIPEEKLSDSALKNKPKSFKNIGEKGASVKPPKGRKTKKTPKLTKKSDDDVDEEEDKEDLQD